MTTTEPRPLRATIRSMGPSFSRTASEIAQVVMEDPSGVMRMTVSELAATSSTSVGSVVRFCQDLGLRGFQDLKLQLAADSSALTSQQPPPDGSPEKIVDSTLVASAEAITDLSRVLDVDAIVRVARRLVEADRVLVLGIGSSSPLAQDAAYRWQSAGIGSFAPLDAHVQHVSASMLRRMDVCVALSHTGQTHEPLHAMRAAASTGATKVAITSFARSPLTDMADEIIIAGAAETAYRVEAMTSRFAHLAVIDTLYSLIQHTQPESSQAAGDRVAQILAEHRL